jgi:hypothetical protein
MGLLAIAGPSAIFVATIWNLVESRTIARRVCLKKLSQAEQARFIENQPSVWSNLALFGCSALALCIGLSVGVPAIKDVVEGKTVEMKIVIIQ